MKVLFAEIPEEGLVLQVNDEAWFPDSEVSRCGPVRVRLQLQAKGMGRVLLKGHMATRFRLTCDRCLVEYEQDLAEEFQLDLEVAPEFGRGVAEHQCDADEMDTVHLSEPVIDVFQLLFQQVFLLMPAKKVCHEECLGLCPQCGTNRNTSNCDCDSKLQNSPFDILAGLRKQKM